MGMLKKAYKLWKLTMLKKYKEKEMKDHCLKEIVRECSLSCNAHCKHCSANAESKKYPWELTTQEIKDWFKQIAHDMDASKIFINVTGWEPLFRKDLCEVMSYATNELGFNWWLATNGILLNDENIEKLKKANLNTISISIDWLEETHNEFRWVQNAYKTIIENIKKLKKSNFVKIIQVTTVLNKNNINQIEKLYNVMLELGIDSRRIMPMDPVGRANEHKDLFLDGLEIKKVLDFIKTKKNNKKMEVTYGCTGFLGLDYEKEVRNYYFYCRTGINIASILYNWDLFVCPNIPRLKHLIQGNIKTDNFKDVRDNKYKEFRTINRTKCDHCEKCKFWDFCLGGSYHTWNPIEKKQNMCPYELIYFNK